MATNGAWIGKTMSEDVTLHPYDPRFVVRYVAAIQGRLAPEDLLPQIPEWALQEFERDRKGYRLAVTGSEIGANVVTAGLARTLATIEPVFVTPGVGLSQLEARYDRSIGMLLRPPSRLFSEAGLEINVARIMPIRLDASGTTMGGTFIPPSLVAQFAELLDRHAERLALRMAEAYVDAPAMLAILIETAAYAASQGKGLFEATGVVVPGVPASYPPGTQLVTPDGRRLTPELRRRLEEAARPPKKPGLLSRLFGRSDATQAGVSRNGRQPRPVSDVTPPPEHESQDQEG
jgi:hypothetical protein